MSEIHIENENVYIIVETFRKWLKRNDKLSSYEIDPCRNYTSMLLVETSEQLGSDLKLSQREIDHIRLIFNVDLSSHKDCDRSDDETIISRYKQIMSLKDKEHRKKYENLVNGIY